MTLRLSIFALAATLLCGFAPAASARQTPTKLAMTLAHRYWGATPCGGQITVSERQTLPTGLDASSDAWVTFGTPFGDNNLTAAASTFTRCTIDLGRVRWPSRTSRVQDWDMLCMTVIHEYGHLLGHAHDLTPGSVMAPVFTDYSSEPRICRTSRPRG